jgi:hypothetical protein
MTDVARLSVSRFGIHASATDFSAAPTPVTVRLTDDGASFLPRQRSVLPRALRSLSGRRYAHVRGAQDVADITANMEFRGIDSNSGGAVSNWEAKMEQGDMLASLFGAVAPATTSTAPVVAAGGHTPASGILAVTGTNTANGQVVGFTTSLGFEVGRIASGGGTTTLTLDRPYNGTPTTAATVFRAAVYTVADGVTHHIHGAWDLEGEDWRRRYLGCAPMSMSLSIPNTGLLGFTSVWAPTTWEDVAELNPAHTEPTAGSPIVADVVRLYLDDTPLIARDIAVSYSCATTVRTAATRTNGRLGGVCGTGDGKTFTVEFSVYIGSGALSGELSDGSTTPDLNALLGDDDAAGDLAATRGISLQVGSEAGAALYIHMPEADCSVTTQHVDGLTVARVVATGTGALPAILAVL